MAHRGPDAKSGYLAIGDVKLGHNRLKILDLDDRSNQPFVSGDGKYIVVFNGEIYNFRELAKEYDLPRRTASDTEVLIELYARKGPDMLGLLNGMFAFVIVNAETGDVFAARDRLGIKPLYCCETSQGMTIASEISPILALTGKSEYDSIALRQYRKMRTFFNGRTLYRGIEMFPAGHYLSGGKFHCYWELPQGRQEAPTDDSLRELIESAVEYRCISDVPVGSYLSGGLDSSLLASLAGKPDTWTVGFADYNEFRWADMVAKQCHFTHTEVVITEDEFVSLAKEMVGYRREPLSVPNEVLLYRMTREVKKRNTVVLSGEGADELFFGYDRVFRWASCSKWNLKEFADLYSYGSSDDLEIVEDAVRPFLKYGKAIDIVAAFFQITHLHGLLRRLDNSTMLCSVEARVPFVDHRLVERMAGVPFGYRMKDGIVKAPLKRVFRNAIPHENLHRKKVGFPVDMDRIPLDQKFNGNSYDRWLAFNLANLANLPK